MRHIFLPFLAACIFAVFLLEILSFSASIKIKQPELSQEVSQLIQKETLKKEFALSFIFYAKNQNVALSQMKAEYYASVVIDRAEHYGTDPKMVKAVLVSESGAREKAISRKGAVGLMQVMPHTAKLFGCGKDLFNPEVNIDCGVRILSNHIGKYGEYAGIRYYLCGEGMGNTYDCLYGMRTEAYLAAIKRESKI